MKELISQAGALGFSGRPLRLELHELKDLALPCILHWNMNHFVVLRSVRGTRITIVDPAVGERTLRLKEVSRHFTGVALELTPNADFKPEIAHRVSLGQLTGKVLGLRRSLLQIIVVALALESFVILAPLFNQMVVDDVLVSGDRELLTVLVIGFTLLLLVQIAIGLARSWMVMVLGQTLSLQWMSNVFSHLIRLPVDFFEKRHVGDVVSRFAAVQAIQRTLTTGATEALLDGLMVLAALAMMFLYAPRLAWITCGAVIFYGLLRWLAYQPLRNAAAERLILSAQESTYFLETIRAVQPIKLFGREDERRSVWQNLVVDVQNRDVRTAKLNIGFSTASTLLFGLENLLVFWVGANIVMSGQVAGNTPFTIGMLLAYVSYKNQFCSRMSSLINYGIELRMLELHAERLGDILLATPEPSEQPLHTLANINPTIEFHNVSFRYANGEPWVLRHASFKIESGDSVAITGASGAGKTTLVKLLLGVMQPTEGDVLFGGIPVSRLGVRNMRLYLGTVMQDDVLLSGSLAENISCYDVQADLALIEDCAQRVNIHEEILQMPMGYQTLVGDLGAGLSGGQKQRVLLARALYKRPVVLVLDEATSHLDLSNERSVVAALKDLQLTRVVIAHRPETIEAATRVLDIRRGHLHEKKPVAELGNFVALGSTDPPVLNIQT